MKQPAKEVKEPAKEVKQPAKEVKEPAKEVKQLVKEVYQALGYSCFARMDVFLIFKKLKYMSNG
ncbi:MAG: hypothetical protein RSD28_01495 [Lachnospiraceae bacterium]